MGRVYPIKSRNQLQGRGNPPKKEVGLQVVNDEPEPLGGEDKAEIKRLIRPFLRGFRGEMHVLVVVEAQGVVRYRRVNKIDQKDLAIPRLDGTFTLKTVKHGVIRVVVRSSRVKDSPNSV